jgi:colicin import membrane protein
MAEKKEQQQTEKKTGDAQGGSGQGKVSGGSPQKKTSSVSRVKATAEKANQKAKKVAERTGGGIASVGKAAQEMSQAVQERIEKKVTPAAQRAGRKVTQTTKKVGEELGPVAEKAKQSLADTSKKVREEIGPAAEKAGKGLSAIFKSTARATRKSARILGIKASIATEMRKRQKLLSELGELYFHLQKKKTPSKSDQDALDALVRDIKKVDAEIHALEVKEKTTREST